MVDLLSDLNESQRQAVTCVNGPLLVVAGAGSGKTRVITRRVGYMVEQGIAPWHILAITFTNKAAGEMRQRVASLGMTSGATVCTFHSLCVRLLREFADPAGLSRNFSIYDSDDQLRCIKRAMEASEVPTSNVPPGAIHSTISRAKNALQDAPTFAAAAKEFFDKTVAKVYRQYERLLAESKALDFDDLLMRMAFLLRDHPEVRQELAQRYTHILIDEYQDTNHAQYVIAHGIAMEHENICATGDPDQSIYAWRGADIRNIMEFEADYPNAQVVRLEHNYRSTAPILQAASNLISHNRQRKHKQLIAVREGGADVQIVRLFDEKAEADEVGRTVMRLKSEGLAYSDMAIFYRVNALSRVLEEALRRHGIAYQIARGVEFYNRAEIKDVLAYLRLLSNPFDAVSCRRVINVPARGIGATTLGRLEAAAESRGISLLEACSAPEQAGLGSGAAGKVKVFAELIKRLTAAPVKSIREVIEQVIKQAGIEEYLKKDEQEKQAWENVQELVSSAKEFDEENEHATLADYLQQVSLVADIDSLDPAAGAVTLMSLHAAKGLEFPVVFVVGCEDGLLPFQRANGQPADIEEERRLAFVGMTRARDRLFLTSAQYRNIRGMQTRQVESSFLNEIGSDGVTRLDKAPQGPALRHRPMDVDTFNRGVKRHADGFFEEVDQRAAIEAIEAIEERHISSRFAGIRIGRRVRHPIFGIGVVQQVHGQGDEARAVVEFPQLGCKTLILAYARLEPL